MVRKRHASKIKAAKAFKKRIQKLKKAKKRGIKKAYKRNTKGSSTSRPSTTLPGNPIMNDIARRQEEERQKQQLLAYEAQKAAEKGRGVGRPEKEGLWDEDIRDQ